MPAADSATTLVLGAGGGVAWAFLALLRQDAALRERAQARGWIWVDAGPRPPGFEAAIQGLESLSLWEHHVGDEAALEVLLRRHAVTQVLDLAGVDTFASIRVADRCGAQSLGTCFETEFEPSPPCSLQDRALQAATALLPAQRPSSLTRAHVLCAGMNPGLIELVALEAIERFSRFGVGDPRDATVPAADIYAVILSELDDALTDGDANTWSPRHCELEVREPVAAWAVNGSPVWQAHPVIGTDYIARCGDAEIEGWLVPHDELITLSQRLAGLEVAYIYRLSSQARRHFVATMLGPPSPLEGGGVAGGAEMLRPLLSRAYPPWGAIPSGFDRVGALIASKTRGEYWLGWTTSHASAARLNTNATQLQVAVGVACVWETLDALRPGVYCVGDLDREALLMRASTLLGPLHEVHDASALYRPLAARRRLARGSGQESERKS